MKNFIVCLRDSIKTKIKRINKYRIHKCLYSCKNRLLIIKKKKDKNVRLLLRTKKNKLNQINKPRLERFQKCRQLGKK